MRVRWLGQSAFHLTAGSTSVLIDPFDDIQRALASRGRRFAYPVERDLPADLLVVTHEHRDHNGVAMAAGEPHLVRLTAGTYETPAGTVLAIASEHDDAAGTLRGPNLIVAFELDGLRVCHFGDFGQSDLGPEQESAIGRPAPLFVPVGGGPTMGGDEAGALARRLEGALGGVHALPHRVDRLPRAGRRLPRALRGGAMGPYSTARPFEIDALRRDAPVAVVPRR